MKKILLASVVSLFSTLSLAEGGTDISYFCKSVESKISFGFSPSRGVEIENFDSASFEDPKDFMGIDTLIGLEGRPATGRVKVTSVVRGQKINGSPYPPGYVEPNTGPRVCYGEEGEVNIRVTAEVTIDEAKVYENGSVVLMKNLAWQLPQEFVCTKYKAGVCVPVIDTNPVELTGK